ncbi:MAG: GlgC family sugar phosphate nucleotidyltransferase, partial [Solirubrobacteraceae bacterium]
TVAAIRVPIDQADQFGVIETAADGRTITAFREKPKDAVGLPDAPDQVYASMGNYVFSTETLVDVVTLDAFYDAHMDLISVHPVFNLYNMEWPILTLPDPLPPAKFVFADDDGRKGHALDSMVCSGVIISGAEVTKSVLSPNVHLHSYASVEGSVLFSGVEIGRKAVVRKAILDKDVYVEPGAEIGVDLDADREAGFTVSDAGVVVIPKGVRVHARVKT